MFEELMDYAEKVDSGEIIQGAVKKPYPVSMISPENNYMDNQEKRTEIKNYIESRIQGITVEVTGGEKLIRGQSDEYSLKRRPLKVRTFKNNEPYDYNEMEFYGCLDERNYASLVYDNYLDFLISNKHIKTGRISKWEHIISEWINDNCYYEFGYYCDDNQLYRISEDENCYEIIIQDIEREAEGMAETSIQGESGAEDALVIICADKQVLLGYDRYYIMETF